MHDPERYRRLWEDVIWTACAEAMGRVSQPHSGASREKITRDADRWFRRPSDDFAEVCGLAGSDPGYVRRLYLTGRLQRAWAARSSKQMEDVA